MLQEVFYWIFNMSITGAVTGLAVLLIRSIRGIPRRFTSILWAIPFLRMIVPFGVGSPYSLMSLLSNVTTKTVVVYQPAQDVTFSMMNSVMAANSYFPITYKVNLLEDVFRVASLIWVCVAIAIALALAILYVSTLYELKDATCLQGNVYRSHKVTSPAVYGIVRPKIVLPQSYELTDAEMVILHEKTHIRRGDNLWRILGFLAAAVHWFNPFSWLFLKIFLGDLELACDEGVLSRLGAHRAKEYALALVESKQGKTVFASAFGGAKIRTRVENILSFRKLTWFSACIFSLLLGVIFYVLLTNAG